MWNLADIVPYDRNPRMHSDEQVGLIAQSMLEDGVTAPILVDEHGVIIYGHGRRLAAAKNGFVRYPVVQAIGWSENKKRKARITDNSFALLSTWQPELLKIELKDLSDAGFDLKLLGFDDVQLVSFEVMPGGEGDQAPRSIGNLADKFGIVPFTTLNAREGWWQDRKRAWLSIGIRSEVGRGENLLQFSETINEPDPVKRAAKKARAAA
jgi:hypothetical protein